MLLRRRGAGLPRREPDRPGDEHLHDRQADRRPERRRRPDGHVHAATYSCQYGTDPPVAGHWTLAPATDPALRHPGPVCLGSVCTVTEDPAGSTGLPGRLLGVGCRRSSVDPGTVVAGCSGSVTVTNTVTRLFAGLQITKTVVDPDGGVLAGAHVRRTWDLRSGRRHPDRRFTVAANATDAAFAPGRRAGAGHSDLQDHRGHARRAGPAGRFVRLGRHRPTTPPSVELVAGESATLGVTNTVIRVYSDVTVTKQVTGPADGLVPTDRPFTGTISCQYGTDDADRHHLVGDPRDAGAALRCARRLGVRRHRGPARRRRVSR